MSKQEMLVLADQRLLRVAMENPCSDALGRGLAQAAKDGHESVAIYGFGFHTQVGAAALCEPPVRINCIIDDNTSNQGRRPWNLPVVSLDEVPKRNVTAVILSGNSVEDRLWDNCAALRAAGVAVYRLYASTPSPVTRPVGMLSA